MELLTLKKEFVYKLADDLLILGHRNSEWTGLGPILEEDIAFSSMAQDKIGQSAALYEWLHAAGESDPDVLGFMRNAEQMHNSHLAEYPMTSYAFSLVRHFLFDHALMLHLESLCNSTDEGLAKLARKYRAETKYHIMHANTWVKQLGNAGEEANTHMQEALNDGWNLALGIFESGPNDEMLAQAGVVKSEDDLKEEWLDAVLPLLADASLVVPDRALWQPVYGGRKGQHSEHLQPLLDEMTEVYKIDPSAAW